MSNNKKYWKGVEELNDTPSFQEATNKEFNEYLPAADFLGEDNLLADSKTSRRDFLKYLGFGVTAASLAACETPVNKVIPYVVKSEKNNPGVANYFATSYSDGYDFCDIVVKTREGRPIKIEGNKRSPFSNGAINARVNSSVLSLYDEKRYRAPQIDGAATSWSNFDQAVKNSLDAVVMNGGKIRFLTNTVTSPSTKSLIEEYIKANPTADVKHVTYDAISCSGMLEANQEAFGKAVLPSYDLSKAKSIVSIGADFMNDFPSSIQLTNQYAKGRKPENGWMSKHFQFESSLSLSGSNADVRVPVKPSDQGKVAVELLNYISGKGGKVSDKVKMAGDHLLANKGASIVLAGSNDKNIQSIVVAINMVLNNYGKTLDITKASYLKKGIDSEVASLVKEMNDGSIGALLISGADPIYSMPKNMNFEGAMAKVKTTVVFAARPTVTSQKAKYVAASHHYLESWNDGNPQAGHYSLSQPTINPLFDTRQMQDCLLKWTGSKDTYYDYIRKNWEATAFKMQSKSVFFDDFWNTTLENGFFVGAESAPQSSEENAEDNAPETSVSSATVNIENAIAGINKAKSGKWELEFYSKVGIGDGSQSHNPWLQELPDPISKMTWDNYLVMNPNDAKDLGFATEYGQQKNADTVNLTINGVVYENVPVIAQPGQVKGALGVALGYGKAIGKKDEIIGFNFYAAQNAAESFTPAVSFEATGHDYPVATTQTHQTVMARTSIVRETNLETFKNADKEEYNPAHVLETHSGPIGVGEVDLWASHPVATAGHHWGMSIDLNACIGCGSCVTSCISENNVPVVGKDEVRRSREMHWIRIDRYFSSEDKSSAHADRYNAGLEVVEDNPMVVHQPMMCQHCNHAPCETVCPVAATTHSDEGLNMMTYNRCIGTRYCANNCPYKVRRFNWFSYQNLDKFADLNPSQDDLGRMVLNPDVTVRARGVMEKCSLCVQRIQSGKLDAKKAGKPVEDGVIQTACASACPTNAITFGDLNDKSSKVLAASISDRSYRVIEDIGTQANVYYQMKVRNTETNIA